MNLRTVFGALLAVLGGVGCASPQPANPSFEVTVSDARADLRLMRATPKPLARPVVVIGGWLDPGIVAHSLAADLRRATGDQRIVAVAFPATFTFQRCRDRLVAAVERAFAGADPGWTVEVDVVAVSMGGLVARYAALEPTGPAPAPRRLRMARLFTISTPHRGADLAALPTWDARQIDMRAGSDLLRQLDAALPTTRYSVYPYVRLGDVLVGAANTAPPGTTPWWVANQPLSLPHAGAYTDPRIVADIARRLRHEPPFTTDPPAPLPTE